MSISENPPGDLPIRPAEDKSESMIIQRLQAEARSMRILFNVVLVALIVLVTGLFSFMFRETKMVRNKTHENLRYLAEYKSKGSPV